MGELVGNRLATASQDGTAKIWDSTLPAKPNEEKTSYIIDKKASQ
jgi:hypothetical protein